jgi:hypothetical protein
VPYLRIERNDLWWSRNRTRAAVERTVPFGLLYLSLTVVRCAAHGWPVVNVAARGA